jgi:hypothetical protein
MWLVLCGPLLVVIALQVWVLVVVAAVAKWWVVYSP